MKRLKKVKIPKAIRQQVWLKYNGSNFDNKCYIKWCTNKITVFNYHVGHNIPESKGGTIEIGNLRPICSNCNLSMSSKFTIDEWNDLSCKRKSFCNRIFSFFFN
jgi:5-methylcytosine-specific restriction endonuclease McrA